MDHSTTINVIQSTMPDHDVDLRKFKPWLFVIYFQSGADMKYKDMLYNQFKDNIRAHFNRNQRVIINSIEPVDGFLEISKEY